MAQAAPKTAPDFMHSTVPEPMARFGASSEIRGSSEAAPESAEAEPTSGEVILDRPVHDTGSPWYAILSFFLPILGLIAAFVFRRHNYIRNYKACRKGVVAFAVTLAACVAVLLLFIVIAIL